jgi:hypothetical protein
MASGATATMMPEQLAVTKPVFFAAGVADPDQRAAYVADGEGTVAVGLSDGRMLWRTDRAEWPLISDGQRLVAASLHAEQPNAFELVVLDAQRHGAAVLVSDPVVLPDWVTVATQRRERFWMGAEVRGNLLRLDWEAQARYGGGAAPPPHVRRAAVRDLAGVVRVDLASGAVEPVSLGEQEERARAVRRPPLASEDLGDPWLAGTTVASLIWKVDGADQVLRLETSDPSTCTTSMQATLARGRGLVAQVAPDGGHLLVHQEPARTGSDEWWVFSVTTGGRVATLTHDAGATSPALLGERVFYLVEERKESVLTRALRARELTSNALLWELGLGERGMSAAPKLRQ